MSDNVAVATEEEIEGYYAVKAVLWEIVGDMSRFTGKSTQNYYGIFLDKKPICRLRFKSSHKYLGIVASKEERLPIETINDIYKHSDRIRAVALELLAAKNKSI